MAAAPTSGSSGLLSNHYFRVYLLLLALFAVSVVGPTLEIRIITLITAFGVAVVKAWLVIKHFMHLTIERVVPKLFLAASVVLMALFWGGVSPDVQLQAGRLWENEAAQAAVARGIAAPEAHAGEDHVGDEEHAGTADGAEESDAGAEPHGGAHAEPAAAPSDAGLIPSSKSTGHLLPGGYNFVHAAFWSVVVLVAIGTNAVAIILSIGLALIVLETLGSVPLLRRFTDPLLGVLSRLPGAARVRALLSG